MFRTNVLLKAEDQIKRCTKKLCGALIIIQTNLPNKNKEKKQWKNDQCRKKTLYPTELKDALKYWAKSIFF